MYAINIRSDPAGNTLFKNTLTAKSDIVKEKIFFEIEKMKQLGTETATALECLDSAMETHAIPVYRTRLKIVCSRISSDITLLSIVSGVDLRDYAFAEASVAHNLVDPSRKPGTC